MNITQKTPQGEGINTCGHKMIKIEFGAERPYPEVYQNDDGTYYVIITLIEKKP